MSVITLRRQTLNLIYKKSVDMFAVERYDQAPVQTQIYPRQCVSIWSIVLSVRIIWSFSQQDNKPNAIYVIQPQPDETKIRKITVRFNLY